MGFVYVMSVMSVGFLTVLLLALATEESRSNGLRRALKNFPGFKPGRLLYGNGAGIAVDEGHHAVCLIAARRRNVRLSLVPFQDIVACEIIKDGRRVIQAGPAVRRSAGKGAAGVGGTPAPVHGIELRLHTSDRHIPEHAVAMSGMDEALRWHYLLKVFIERADRAAAPPSADGKATAVARPTAPQAAEPARTGTPKAGEDAMRARVRESVDAIIVRRLEAARRFVISERDLRDQCGLDMPVIRFHEHMNRLKREKSFEAATLSYSRKDESWRISKRK